MGCHGQSVYYLLAGTMLNPAKACWIGFPVWLSCVDTIIDKMLA